MIALITGITGQDGSYLAEFLLEKGYEVHGIERRSSYTESRINTIIEPKYRNHKNLHMHYGDMTDLPALTDTIKSVQPNEIYNLAAQSHVGLSFKMPVYTSEVDGIGVLKILEAIRLSGKLKRVNCTKLLHRNCLVKFSKYHKMKTHLSTQDHRTVFRNSWVTGL